MKKSSLTVENVMNGKGIEIASVNGNFEYEGMKIDINEVYERMEKMNKIQEIEERELFKMLGDLGSVRKAQQLIAKGYGWDEIKERVLAYNQELEVKKVAEMDRLELHLQTIIDKLEPLFRQKLIDKGVDKDFIGQILMIDRYIETSVPKIRIRQTDMDVCELEFRKLLGAYEELECEETDKYFKYKFKKEPKIGVTQDLPQWYWEKIKIRKAIKDEGFVIIDEGETDTIIVASKMADAGTGDKYNKSIDDENQLTLLMEELEEDALLKGRICIKDYCPPNYYWVKEEVVEKYTDMVVLEIDCYELEPITNEYKLLFREGKETWEIELHAPNRAGNETKKGKIMDEYSLAWVEWMNWLKSEEAKHFSKADCLVKMIMVEEAGEERCPAGVYIDTDDEELFNATEKRMKKKAKFR